jgi:hypothetical protein
MVTSETKTSIGSERGGGRRVSRSDRDGEEESGGCGGGRHGGVAGGRLAILG